MSSNSNGATAKKAFPYQRKNIKLIEEEFEGRALLGDEMGLGKSAQSLWFIKRKKLGETLPALIILPKTVRMQWIQAVEEVLKITPQILETRSPSKLKAQSKVVIVNYDIIAWWRDWLEDQNFRTLILDECQACTNLSAKRCKTAVALAKEIPYFLPLSGTPLRGRPIELFPILNAMNPKAWPNRAAYAHRYCGPKWTRFGWDFKGESNISELHARLKQTGLVRNLQKDVLKDLPPMIRTIVPVELSDVEEYQKAKNDFIGWLKTTYPDRLNKAVKAAALVQSGHLLRLAARLKLKNVVEWINLRLSHTEHEKLVVFAVHKKCIRALKRRINAKSVVVDGSVRGRHRDEAIYKFQNDPSTRVLIGNLAAAGIGLHLVAANTLCAVELSQMPGPLLQMEKRIHRIGQDKHCWIYYFIGVGTIEENVSKLVQRKQRTISGVLDGDYVEDDFDLYDLLLEELEKGLLV